MKCMPIILLFYVLLRLRMNTIILTVITLQWKAIMFLPLQSIKLGIPDNISWLPISALAKVIIQKCTAKDMQVDGRLAINISEFQNMVLCNDIAS